MTKKQLGEFVHLKRNEFSLSQQQLADKIDKRRQAIFEVERDLVDYRVSVLLDLLHALGYTLNILPITPIESPFKYDFSKIKSLTGDPYTGPLKKQTHNEKSSRRSSVKK